MPQQALYLKWRPLTFEDVVGQEHVCRTLRNSLKSERIRHAYLFSGPRGTGKTTTARLLAKAVNCAHLDPQQRPCNVCASCVAVNEGRFLDLIEIDAASHTGVDDVRDLRDKIAFSPGEGRYKVYIIDEAHRFSGNAFDALLKTLEEPPDHAIFVLATTEIDKVPATIKSRCLQFEFRRLSLREVADRLETIARSEGIQVEPAAIELIAREGTGSVRDSISLLDQIVVDPKEVITLQLTQQILGTASGQTVHELVAAIVDQDTPRGLHMINTAIDGGSDPKQFGQQVVDFLRSVLLVQTASSDLVEGSAEDRRLFEELSGRVSRGALLGAIRAFNEAINNHASGWHPQLALELALIESTQVDEEVEYIEEMPARPETMTRASTLRSANAADADRREEAGGVIEEHVFPSPNESGEPPIISAAVIRGKWVALQRAIHRYRNHPNLPPLMDHAQVLAVDGNRLVLGVKLPVFLNKLSDPGRVRIIEQALYDVHGVKLRVAVELIDDTVARSSGDSAEADPLVEAGLELGGKVKPIDEDEQVP